LETGIKSNLVPFIRDNLDILFIGLNPAKGSSENRHYFSVKPAFWNQLYDAGFYVSYPSYKHATCYQNTSIGIFPNKSAMPYPILRQAKWRVKVWMFPYLILETVQ